MTEKLKAAVSAYIDLFNKQDAKGIINLYAENASVTDPVGSPSKVGRVAISEFYETAVKSGGKLVQHGPTRIAGKMAAFAFTIHLEDKSSVQEDAKALTNIDLPAGGMKIDVIDTFSFDDDGKIVDMRAYWGPDNITQI